MPPTSMRKPPKLPKLPAWAVQPRRFDETLADLRLEHKHDVDEITYRRAFRKLADKTQALAHPSGGSYRSRLTHTLEVSQIAENFSDEFRLNEELTEAIALAHDLGHTPFAHAGQETLNRLLQEAVTTACLTYLSSEGAQPLVKASFSFRHGHNSRRILQRKMRKISAETLSSVVGHSWSPWKDCAWCDSLSAVESRLKRPLATGGKNRFGLFLRCYEAQAVAISDQIAALSGDVEDLAVLEGHTKGIHDRVFDMLGRTKFDAAVLRRVKPYLEEWVAGGADPEGWDRGWGRKARVHDAVESVVDTSRKRVRECKTPEASAKAPLAPSGEVAIALDVLDQSVRELISINDEIKNRNSAAAGAIETMFNRLLRMYKDPDVTPKNKAEASFRARMRGHFEGWLDRYKVEVGKETILKGAISYPGMKRAVLRVKEDLWQEVKPAIAVVDYISEMTDRFVIEEVFQGDAQQRVLQESFGRRVLGAK